MTEEKEPFYEDDDDARGSLLPDALRKVVATGISAVFMTEEGIRNALSEMRLPKEAVQYVIQQTDRTRKDLFGAVTGELKGFLNRVDLTGEMRKALTGLKLEVKAEVRFVEDDRADAKISTEVSSATETTDDEPTEEESTDEPT